jgi:hypothetical protein
VISAAVAVTLAVLVVFSGCGLFLGPVQAIEVDIALEAVEPSGEVAEDKEVSYWVVVEVAGTEYPLDVGESVTLQCTTWNWITLRLRVRETSGLIDRTAKTNGSILGHDVLWQSPYSITRERSISGVAEGGGDLIYVFHFDLDAREI